ncbi:MAG TPA: hypothetical protein DHW82_03135 [Spirochaetia bacterium]|nr:MAG: hypothetical protein A2Y41_04035 [Spirochaetes bacterium GWB1_36_13]HCL55986.1 hypothetical protein [Spirochaetia bacterium]
MDDVLKWENFISKFRAEKDIKDFLEESRKQLVEKKAGLQKNLYELADIERVKKFLYTFLQLQVKKIGAEGFLIYSLEENIENDLFFKPYFIFSEEENQEMIHTLMRLNIPYDADGNAFAYVIANHKVIYIREVDPELIYSKASKDFFKILPLKSQITFPLFLEKNPVGVIQFYTLQNSLDVSDEVLKILEQDSHSIAMVLKSIILYERMLKNYNKIKKMTLNLREELILAQKIQESLLPKELPKLEGIKISFWYKAMEAIGGDFFDFLISREKDRVGIFISDVAGHGVPAALITTMIKGLLSTSRVFLDNPRNLMKKINTNLFHNNISSFFVTAFYFILNLQSRRAYFSSAGHPPMILYRRKEERTILLTAKGKFLGIFEDIYWEEKEIEICSGDRLLFYTDGISEMMNSEGEELGVENLAEMLKVTHSLDIQAAKKFLINTIMNYENTNLLNDDKVFIIIDID